MSTIVYPLVMPSTPGLRKFAWSSESAVAVQRNEFNFASKRYAWDGQIRRATAEVGRIDNIEQAKEWQAFFLKLNGTEGTFLMQDPAHARAPDALEPTLNDFSVTVDGANQVGNILNTKGWPPSVTGILRKGDYIGIEGRRLYMLLESLDTDTAGNAALSIFPFARHDIADNEQIYVGSQAYGSFRLIETPEFAYDEEKIMSEGIQFSCEEAI